MSLGSSSDVGVELHQGGNLKSSLTKGKNSRGYVFDELALTLLENLLTVWQGPSTDYLLCKSCRVCPVLMALGQVREGRKDVP